MIKHEKIGGTEIKVSPLNEDTKIQTLTTYARLRKF